MNNLFLTVKTERRTALVRGSHSIHSVKLNISSNNTSLGYIYRLSTCYGNKRNIKK